jgi:hypothetical protein
MAFRNLSSPESRLKSALTNAIGKTLKNSGEFYLAKNYLTYLPYDMEDLRIDLERKWSPWMNWENWGTYRAGTRTWQIDHVVPQSLLPYDGLEHPNFIKCWALSNLRPFETSLNLSKGNRVK